MRDVRKLGLMALAMLGIFVLGSQDLRAQPSGLDIGKDCHTIRSCNFGRGGAYRGCLSTFACKQCKFVNAPCTIDGQRKVCQRLRCGWGRA